MKTKIKTSTMAVMIALLASGCAGQRERLANIGNPPPMSEITNPVERPGYQPITLPMPDIQPEVRQANSLWQIERQTFFKDQRANSVGDILTVLINIKDEADIMNTTSRSRTGSESAGIPNLLGYEKYLNKVFPDTVDKDNLASLRSGSETQGSGRIAREEEVKLKLAAMITQVLPNGNLVIHGTQQVRVNFELRELQLSGIIRPEDILNNNSISYEKIAEARIAYGGKGHITDMQQPRYGQQAFDILFPF